MKRQTPFVVPLLVVGCCAGLMVSSEELAAQEQPENAVAEPLTGEELEVFWSVFPADGVQGLALVHVGRMLSPSRFELLIDAVLVVVPDLPEEDLRTAFEEEFAPIAYNVQSCLLWNTHTVTIVCVGNLGSQGFDVISRSSDVCAYGEVGQCDRTETEFPEHVVDFITVDFGMYRVDGTYLVVSGNPEEARATTERLVQGLDTGASAASPLFFNTVVDPSVMFHAISQLPDGLLENLGLDPALQPQVIQLRFGNLETDSSDLEIRATLEDGATAQQLLNLVLATVAAVALMEPEVLETLQLPVDAIVQMLAVEGNDVVLTIESEQTLALVAAFGVPAFVRYLQARPESEDEGEQ